MALKLNRPLSGWRGERPQIARELRVLKGSCKETIPKFIDGN